MTPSLTADYPAVYREPPSSSVAYGKGIGMTKQDEQPLNLAGRLRTCHYLIEVIRMHLKEADLSVLDRLLDDLEILVQLTLNELPDEA